MSDHVVQSPTLLQTFYSRQRFFSFFRLFEDTDTDPVGGDLRSVPVGRCQANLYPSRFSTFVFRDHLKLYNFEMSIANA